MEYARENQFCVNCHANLPTNHANNWRESHGAQAREDQKGCLTCHEMGRPAPGRKSSSISCSQCHQGKHRRPNWKSNHPVPLQSKQRLETRCFQCHPEKGCTSCHSAPA